MTEEECAALVPGNLISVYGGGVFVVVTNDTEKKQIQVALKQAADGEMAYRSLENMIKV